MSPETITETRDVQNFNRVDLRSFGTVEIVQGESESLTIEADQELLPKIQTEVRDGTLIVDIGRDWLEKIFSGLLILGDQRVHYHLKVKDIQTLRLSGRFEAHSEAIRADRLALAISGSGKIRIDSLQTGKLDVDVSGHGSLDLSGQAVEQDIQISGSGEYHALDLQSGKAGVRISGSGEAEVWTTDKLEVRISGAGKVLYRGRPSISQSISGAGRIQQQEG